MELSAFGIPLEPLRYIWLIAFIVYIGLCIVPAITHPATISTEKAKELYIARYGSPVNNAMRYAERRSLRVTRYQNINCALTSPVPAKKSIAYTVSPRLRRGSTCSCMCGHALSHGPSFVCTQILPIMAFCYRLCCCRSTWCSWVHVQVAALGVKPAASIRMT